MHYESGLFAENVMAYSRQNQENFDKDITHTCTTSALCSIMDPTLQGSMVLWEKRILHDVFIMYLLNSSSLHVLYQTRGSCSDETLCSVIGHCIAYYAQPWEVEST